MANMMEGLLEVANGLNAGGLGKGLATQSAEHQLRTRLVQAQQACAKGDEIACADAQRLQKQLAEREAKGGSGAMGQTSTGGALGGPGTKEASDIRQKQRHSRFGNFISI